MAALKRWGLLDAVLESGCPAITGYRLDFGPIIISGTTQPVEGITTAYAPRRTVLDAALVAGAREAGVEVREDYNVDEVLVEDGRVVGIRRGEREDRARIVIGADGRNSLVAKAVHAVNYNTKPRLQYSYYTYFSGLPTDQFETFVRPDRGFACAPTNDGLTMVVAGWPYAEAQAYKADVEGNFFQTLAAGSRLRGPRGEGETGGALPRRSGTELVPQALRRGVGAGRRCRLQQGPDHRAGHHRRLPRCRTVHRRGPPVARRGPASSTR